MSFHLVCNSRALSWINARSICTYTARSNYHQLLFSSFYTDENFSHYPSCFDILIIIDSIFLMQPIIHFLTLYSTIKLYVFSFLFLQYLIYLLIKYCKVFFFYIFMIQMEGSLPRRGTWTRHLGQVYLLQNIKISRHTVQVCTYVIRLHSDNRNRLNSDAERGFAKRRFAKSIHDFYGNSTFHNSACLTCRHSIRFTEAVPWTGTSLSARSGCHSFREANYHEPMSFRRIRYRGYKTLSPMLRDVRIKRMQCCIEF